MKKREPVSKIMTSDVITLNHTDNLETAEQLFREKNIRHIPVVSGKSVIGMLSLTDLLRISFADAASEENVDTTVYKMFTLEQVMAKKIVSISSDTTIKEAAEILSEKEFHALPVVDNGELTGIATTTDMINYLLDQY
ncbi:MAG: CBS domain-containing protein [Crocinitomicaceae bacterium]|nr:CBS domain-containing protein [Flavobacteriales bacterium]NQZ35984.1 CBS domain-containing protein [Crocinitomicaceae bacterium]